MRTTRLLFISLICLLSFTQNPIAYCAKNIIYTPPSENPSMVNRYEQYVSEGLVLLNQNQYPKAATWFKKAQGFLPNMPEAYLYLGIINIHQGNIDEAERLLKRAEKLLLNKQANKSIIFYNLGICSHIKENYQQAIEYFSLALETKPSFDNAKHGLAMSSKNIKEKNKDTSKNSNKKQLPPKAKGSPKIPTDKESLNMANKFLKEGSQKFNKDNDKAILLIKKSISLKPDNPEAYYRLGVIYDRQVQFLKAEECFKNALKLDPQMAKAYLNLGSVYGKSKKYNLALKAFVKAAKLDHQNPKIPYNISMTYIATGKAKQALKYLKEAEDLCQKNDNTAFLKKIETVLQNMKGE